MPTSIENLYTKVFVRRVGVGAAPFSWEIIGANAATPIFISSDRFRSMEAAYAAGREKLGDFLRSKPAKREKSHALPAASPEMAWQNDWQAVADDEDETGFDIDLDSDDEPTMSREGEACPVMPDAGVIEA